MKLLRYLVPSIIAMVLLVSLNLSAQEEAAKGEEQDGKKVVRVAADEVVVITKAGKDAGTAAKSETAKGETAEEGMSPEDLSVANLAGLKQELLKQWEAFTNWKGFEAWKLVVLFCGIVVTMILARLARWFIEHLLLQKMASKTQTEIDDLVCQAIGKPASLVVFVCGLYVSSLPILTVLSATAFKITGRIFLAVAASGIAWGIFRLISVINHVLAVFAAKTDNNFDDLIVSIIRKSLKITVAILSVLFIGQNILGLNITALLAGAGVMGLAIAFAAQDTISNFFGSIMIILDQPFTTGERIQSSSFNGTVEKVGFRSSRLRTLDGHLITVPNKELANSVIDNISKRPYLKQHTVIGLTYDTSPEKMEKAVEILHELFDNHEGLNEEMPPRIVFDSFGDWSLNIAVTIWYHPADYGAFKLWGHRTNMEILRRFNEAGLDFAFPSNTTYVAYDENRRIGLDVKMLGESQQS